MNEAGWGKAWWVVTWLLATERVARDLCIALG